MGFLWGDSSTDEVPLANFFLNWVSTLLNELQILIVIYT